MSGVSKQWDVFISHASEDKEAVVLPLAAALVDAGVKVWLDRQQLRIGDSIRASIDEGLARSRFGVVVISEAFLAKRWPALELNALMALEEDDQKIILPVWHRVTRSQVAEYSPMLSDRLAADTQRGVAYVASEIENMVFDPKSGSPSSSVPSVGRRFSELLHTSTSATVIARFLAAHPAIFLQLHAVHDVDIQLGGDAKGFDLSVRPIAPSLDLPAQRLVFLPADVKPFEGESSASSVASSVASLYEVMRRDPKQPEGIVVVGRRSDLTDSEREHLKSYNRSLTAVTVHTYDWLIDIAGNLSDWAIEYGKNRLFWSTPYSGFNLAAD